LLITAPPGSGKSVFSNFTIKHLQSQLEASTKVIYYFCNIHISIPERSAEAVIRALIVQLCKNQRSLMNLLPSRFEQDWKEFFKASSTELLETLRKMLEEYPHRIYCIIDGLDVYGPQMVDLTRKLVSCFTPMAGGLSPPRKLLCTSRPTLEILEAWKDQGSLQRRLRARTSDLLMYIDKQTAKLDNARYSKRMRDEVQSALKEDVRHIPRVNRPMPTFLWVSITLRKIKLLEAPSVNGIKDAIMNSSLELETLFKDLITAAATRDKSNAKILAWVVYNKGEPLSLNELQEAVAISPGKDYQSYEELEDDRSALNETILHWRLGTLLDVIKGRVFVIHQSLQDYIEEEHILEKWVQPHPRLLIGVCCMRYLLLCYSNDFETEVTESKSEEVFEEQGVSLLQVRVVTIHLTGF
jgi:hypothetical protein